MAYAAHQQDKKGWLHRDIHFALAPQQVAALSQQTTSDEIKFYYIVISLLFCIQLCASSGKETIALKFSNHFKYPEITFKTSQF